MACIQISENAGTLWLVFFCYLYKVILNRSKISLLLLGAYVLLLLHDFIPHTHQGHQANVHITSASHHDSEDHHHHHHGNHEEERKGDKNPEPSDNNSFGDHLIDLHNHSGFSGHAHDLVYRGSAKHKLIFPVDDDAKHLLSDIRKPMFPPDDSKAEQVEFITPPFDPHLSSLHRLRAPPTLG